MTDSTHILGDSIADDKSGGLPLVPAPEADPTLDEFEAKETVEDNSLEARIAKLEAREAVSAPVTATPVASPTAEGAALPLPADTVAAQAAVATIPEQHPSEALPAPIVAVPEGEQHPLEAPAQTFDSGTVSRDVLTSGSGVLTTSDISDDEAAEKVAADQDIADDADKDAQIAKLQAELDAMRSTNKPV